MWDCVRCSAGGGGGVVGAGLQRRCHVACWDRNKGGELSPPGLQLKNGFRLHVPLQASISLSEVLGKVLFVVLVSTYRAYFTIFDCCYNH
jgi:hypothetical protein